MEELDETYYRRHRSPSFDKEEVKLLLNLIHEFKDFILNKSNTLSACRAKELAWVKITNKFNSHGFKNARTAEGLKYKWRNLVNNVKKQSRNLLDANQDEFDEFSNQILSLIHDEDIHNSEVALSIELEDVMKDLDQKKKYCNTEKINNNNSQPEDSSDEEVKIIRNRGINFSSQECRLLLKCVQAERKYIFSKDHSSKARYMRNAAWARITAEFNRQSDEKRSRQVLQRKLLNMKHATKKACRLKLLKNKRTNQNYNKISEEPDIKPEPLFELEDEQLNDNEDKSESDDNSVNGALRVLKAEDPDPLSTVLNSDSGLGSSVNLGTFNPFENNEVVKLKMELLKYKIENAKLKKTRLENAIREDAREQEQAAITRSLRLRSARLEAVASEMKLPPGHPALVYTDEELPAQAYLKQCRT